MTTQRPSATATTRSPITSSHYTPEQAAFFGVLGHNSGAQELVAGTPDTYGHIHLLVWTAATFRQPGHVHTRAWIEDGQERKAARHIAEQAAEWGNVYCSVGTYAKVANTFNSGTMRYCRDVPLPRHCFALDDVRDLAALRLPPTLALETSPNNYQAIYRCDDLLIPRHAVQFATGAATFAGCDPSGADAEQLIRIPGTRNTKPKCGPDSWTVRLVFADGPTYSREQLARAFLPGGLADLHREGGTVDTPPCMRNDATSSTATSEVWQIADALNQPNNIRRGGPWLTQNGAIRRLKLTHFINNILTGASVWTGAPGGAATYSEFRHHLIKALWLHGFPEPEIRILSHHLAADDTNKRGSDGLRADIDRIIIKLASAHPRDAARINPTPHLTTGEPCQRPIAARAKRRVRNDRPGLKGGTDELLHRYTTDSALCALPQTARATALGVALATLKRMESHLQGKGRISIERMTTATGWATHVLVEPAYDEPSPLGSPIAIVCVTTPQSAAVVFMESTPAFGPPQSDGEAASGAAASGAAIPEAPALADAAEKTSGVCSPDVAPSGSEHCESGVVFVLLLTLLRTAIRASFDRWQATQRLDQRTGELKRCNVTRHRIEVDLWAEGLGLAAPELVGSLIVEERQRRERLALKALSFDGLRAELRKTEARFARAQRRHESTGWLDVRIDLLQAEMRTRPAEPEEVKRRRRKGGPARPDQRAAAKQYELELLDQVDAALGRVPLRGSCGRQTTRDRERDTLVTKVLVHE